MVYIILYIHAVMSLYYNNYYEFSVHFTIICVQFVDGLPGDEMQSLLMIKVLARKPGWKDSNFQVCVCVRACV